MGPSLSFTTRETEVLRWLKEGKTSWDIAVILSVSERTVNFHVQNIKRKANAVNRAQAVAVAIGHGLLA
jgi:LuxR family transcriptional regulator, quorum-sensing system regulator CviR